MGRMGTDGMDYELGKKSTYNKVATRDVIFDEPEDFHLKVRLARRPQEVGWRLEVWAIDYNAFGCPEHRIHASELMSIAEHKRRLPDELTRIVQNWMETNRG